MRRIAGIGSPSARLPQHRTSSQRRKGCGNALSCCMAYP
ncbi:hypothetical protein RHECNPAF_2940029 [Rhizobium etli CNPAF512]|nr:hypothetical protein RHECNPAF_2940029 [Rhizobium etli CNPAF512]